MQQESQDPYPEGRAVAPILGTGDESIVPSTSRRRENSRGWCEQPHIHCEELHSGRVNNRGLSKSSHNLEVLTTCFVCTGKEMIKEGFNSAPLEIDMVMD